MGRKKKAAWCPEHNSTIAPCPYCHARRQGGAQPVGVQSAGELPPAPEIAEAPARWTTYDLGDEPPESE